VKCDDLISRLRALGNPANLPGMARYGIKVENALGVSVPSMRKLAREAGRDTALAEDLWASGLHEARMLAGFVADPATVTEDLLDRWVVDFDSWDLCDEVCSDLFSYTPFAFAKCAEWSRRDEEFVKRAAFALMAALAVHDKTHPDKPFLRFLGIIKRESRDDRNFVKKAVNWALRNIGKRNLALNAAAITTAEQIRALDSRPARWIAADALRELTGDKVQARLRAKGGRV
jgi:3-methyladenine DNA glycosylase AlkD